jgi:probable F420-dependent oxidoreductase
MAAADATRTLRVGNLVLDNDYRHPVMLAKAAATIDVLSNGRFELGLGAGWAKAEYQQGGMRFDPPGTRISRLEEAVRVIKGLFASDPLTFAGSHYKIDELNGFPKPIRRPHPPILIGGSGKRMLALAAREATTIGIMNGDYSTGVGIDDPSRHSPEAMSEKIQWIRQEAGARFEQLELSMVVAPILTSEWRQGAELAARQHGWNTVGTRFFPRMFWRCPLPLLDRLKRSPNKWRSGESATGFPTTSSRMPKWRRVRPSSLVLLVGGRAVYDPESKLEITPEASTAAHRVHTGVKSTDANIHPYIRICALLRAGLSASGLCCASYLALG